MVVRVKAEIYCTSNQEATDIAAAIKSLVSDKWPHLKSSANPPFIEVSGRTATPKVNYKCTATLDQAAKRLVLAYTFAHKSRSFIAPYANTVPGLAQQPVPFLLVSVKGNRTFWAYCKQEIGLSLDSVPRLMEELQNKLLTILPDLEPTIVCSGLLLDDGLCGKLSTRRSIKYSDLKSVDFTVRQWDGTVKAITAENVHSLFELKELQ